MLAPWRPTVATLTGERGYDNNIHPKGACTFRMNVIVIS